jgi:hypothetical protein
MIRLLFFLLSLSLTAGAAAQPALSDSATVSLMTVASGNEVYSIFGHSALRVRDPLRRLDRCYNYGTFDFEQPNFLLKFCRGKLLYMLDTEPYRSFEYGNIADRRAMREQLLNLGGTERQALFSALEKNALPENRSYKYDFFYDNCATRIRDIAGAALEYRIRYDSTGLARPQTMRQLLRPYLARHPWTQFGIDLVLGRSADRTANAQDFMFLPDYVHDMFSKASVDGTAPLVRSERQIPPYSFEPEPFQPGFFSRPLWVMCLVALIGLLSMAHPRNERIFDAVFWFVLGVAGLIMALLWFATDHSATKMNFNLLWALPTHLFFFWRRSRTEVTEAYFRAAAILAALALLFWKFMPQEMPVAAMPIAALVVVKGMWRRWKTVDGGR